MFGVESGERTIDEEDDARFVSSRSTIHRRQDARRHAVNDVGLGGFENAQTPCAARLHLMSGPGERFLDLRSIRRRPGNTGCGQGAKKRAAIVDIMHDLSPASVLGCGDSPPNLGGE